MALSGFIKQLLETDTVFGSEAKKVTGINDSTVRISYRNSSITFKATDTTFELVINNYTDQRDTPWLISDKYIKFFFRDYESNNTNAQLVHYQDRLFKLLSDPVLDPTNNTLTIQFEPNVEGTPPFSQLPSNSFTNVDLIIDGRIFVLIGDPEIAREASNGSTMFNLDNTSSTEFTVDSSGIANKYASHYHTDISSELTVHDRDDAGYPLIRPAISTIGESQTIIYDEAAALTQAQARVVNTANTKVTFTLGLNSTVVAEFGQVALNLFGDFITIGSDEPPRYQTPFGNETNSDGFTFKGITWVANLNSTDVSDIKKNWPVPTDPSFDPSVVVGIAINDLLPLLRVAYPNYTFTREEPVNNQITITYRNTVAEYDVSEPIPINNGGTGSRIFHDSSRVVPGQDYVLPTSPFFITRAELLTALRDNTLGFDINDPEGFIVLTSDSPGTRSATFAAPTILGSVFSNLNPTEGLEDIPVTPSSFRTISLLPELVFDLEGNAVFNLVTSVVQEA